LLVGHFAVDLKDTHCLCGFPREQFCSRCNSDPEGDSEQCLSRSTPSKYLVERLRRENCCFSACDRKAIELDSDFSEAHKILALVYSHMGQSDEAVSEARKALELNSSDGETQATLGYAYAIAGRKEQAEQMLALLRQSAKPGTLYFQAYVHMGLGQREKTLECLEKSQEIDQRGAHGTSMTSTGNIELDTPIFDPLHTDPRYQELRRRKNKQEHLE
jgi:tetratricopeptide (TPR) repeat protein